MLSVTRIFRLGIRFAAWVTPHVKEWHRQRHLNRVEGQRHLQSRNWSEAEKHLALALAERRHSATRRLELLLDLEKAQLRQHKLAEAEETVRTAIDLAVQTKDPSMHSRALDALVDVQLEQGKYAEAEKTTGEIARLESARPKPDRARLAKCSHKLGTALLKSERPAEAMEAFQRAAELSEQAFGAEHVETANSFSELGMLYRQKGDHAEAQRCLRRALQVHRAASGHDSHEATQALFQLAASLEESGDLQCAAGEYERVLALKERQVGGNREETAEAQVHLAALYLNAGRSSAARELLTSAIAVLERKGGQRLALALETLACVEEQVGRPADAKRWREQAATLAANGVV
jgi:tetratricopeptide (TPR) repeat protein